MTPSAASASDLLVVLEEPTSLESLPPECLQQILCVAGCARTADALSATSQRIHCTLLDEGILPIVTSPAADQSFASAKQNIVAWDASARMLRKTARLGTTNIIFAERLHQRNVLLELAIEELPSVGGVWLGINTYKNEKETRCGQRWCDGTGRVHARDDDGTYTVELCGQRVREGDVVGVCFLPSNRQVTFTLNGARMGPALPLPEERFFAHFYARFDCVEGTRARVVHDRNAPLDLRALLSTSSSVLPRAPLAPCETVLVRTVGPDSRYYEIRVDPERASVADLHERILEALAIDSWRTIELRVSTSGSSASNMTGTVALNGPYARGDEATTLLRDCGLGFDCATGAQRHDIIVSEPHLIS